MSALNVTLMGSYFPLRFGEEGGEARAPALEAAMTSVSQARAAGPGWGSSRGEYNPQEKASAGEQWEP